MVDLLLNLLGDDLHTLLLSHWLDVRSLVTLDIAISSKTCRPYWMKLLYDLRSRGMDEMDHTASSLMWLSTRGICISRMQMKVNAWKVPGCDLSLLRTVDLLHIGLNGCINVTDHCIEMIATLCRKLSNIRLEGCISVECWMWSAAEH
jgi:hypothetical protein